MMLHLECSNDEALVRALGVPRKAIRHHSGSGPVAHALKQSSRPCIGMVDEDPHSTTPSYFSTFAEVERGDGLLLKEHKKCGHKLIVVMPDLEPWLLLIAKGIKVPPESFQLPSVPNRLHQIGDSQRLRYSDWIKRMHEQGAPGLLRLHRWLSPGV
ncbi:hypothetical protein OKA05_01500 [Luteolibacter arcticus]|uniref:Uncharacterized protein n=1 Tax=Luteolibacter arcticus TaxID=1581411 RepID=A0ABT3GC50_9BACT|nr:hypothetical protein [Luteolibacter arcticus]MCW1921207.1 hypothetical protein [Luteolibacter arcticus]